MSDGLARVALLPVGGGYFSATAGVVSSPDVAGAFGRIEGGWHPLQPLTLFGYGQATALPTGVSSEAGVGARVGW